MQVSKKLTCIKAIPKQSGRKYKNSAREDVYTDKQLRPVLYKAMKNQSHPLTPSQIIQI